MDNRVFHSGRFTVDSALDSGVDLNFQIDGESGFSSDIPRFKAGLKSRFTGRGLSWQTGRSMPIAYK